MLRLKRRGLETDPRSTLHGHEGGNPGYRQGTDLRGTAPVLDPTALKNCGKYIRYIHPLTKLLAHGTRSSRICYHIELEDSLRDSGVFRPVH